MTIAYICSMKNGLPSFIYREIKALFENGITIDIFTTKFKPGLYMPEEKWHYYHYHPIIVLVLQPFYLIKYYKMYFTILSEALHTNSLIDYFISFYYVGKMKGSTRIHCHEAMHTLFIGYYCSKILNIPLSVTIHADAFYVNPNPVLTKKALAYCDSIITISNYNRDKIVHDYGVASSKIHVIRLGVNTDKFSLYNKKSIMIVGQYAERKGHEDLIKAFKNIMRDDLELWIVGSGSWGGGRDYVDVKGLVKKYGIENNVVYFENIPESFLQFLYAHCTIFCLPSKKSSDGNCEGLPVSIMEAMASYKPVVSTFHTGIPEIVKGPLVAEGDWEGLAKAIDSLLNISDDELRIIGKENRKIIEQEYSSKENVKKLADYFNNMMKKGD